MGADHVSTMGFFFFVGGSGNSLNASILLSAGICTIVATVVAFGSIYLQLKNYRKPILQRYSLFVFGLHWNYGD